jgi:ubiquinol-cytochrome c reductase iron-sulfur subunit
LPDFAGKNTGEWLVQTGVCTHLGCVPIGDGAGDFRRLVLPLPRLALRQRGPHPSRPRPENLPIPRAEFVDETTILLG